MIVIEREGAKHIRFTTKEKKLFDRALMRALLYSLLLHVVVFGLFRIKTTLNESGQPLPAIEVSVFSENTEEEPLAVVESLALASNKKPFFEMQPDLAPITFVLPLQDSFSKSQWITSYCLPSYKKESLIEESSTIDLTPVCDLHWKEHVYPLLLDFSPTLHNCTLIEDGSSLFCEKKENYAPSTKSVRIEYSITVGNEGKITSWSRKKEFSNKRMQHVADTIIQSLRFAETGKDSTGKVWLQFTCSPEELERYIVPGALS